MNNTKKYYRTQDVKQMRDTVKSAYRNASYYSAKFQAYAEQCQTILNDLVYNKQSGLYEMASK